MKIDRDIIRQNILSLSEWQTVEQFGHAVTKMSDEWGRYAFTADGTNFWREAYVAHQFALNRGASELTLKEIHNGPRDFWIKVNGCELSYEVTLAMKKGRDFDKEYTEREAKNPSGSLVPFPPTEWETLDDAIQALEKICKQKARKDYFGTYGIIIYLNVCSLGISVSELAQHIHASTETVKNKFPEVWVKWNSRLYLIWYDALAFNMASESEYSPRSEALLSLDEIINDGATL